MKKILLVTMLILSLALAACGKPAQEGAGNPEPAPASGSGSAPADTNAPSTPVEYKDVDENSLSGELAAWVEEMRQMEGTFVRQADGGTYVLVSLGEKPTGGYEVKVAELVRKGNMTSLKAEATAPGADAMVTQAITYPTDLIFVPAGVKHSLEVIVGDQVSLLTLTE